MCTHGSGRGELRAGRDTARRARAGSGCLHADDDATAVDLSLFALAQVLTFDGYFKEAVVESSTESFRIRRVVFKYFVEDDTCQVIELKVENSGMDQGPFIKRHALPKAGGGFLHWTDFHIGEDVLVYGRVFRITAVDEFTRVRGRRVVLHCALGRVCLWHLTRACLTLVSVVSPSTEVLHREWR